MPDIEFPDWGRHDIKPAKYQAVVFVSAHTSTAWLLRILHPCYDWVESGRIYFGSVSKTSIRDFNFLLECNVRLPQNPDWFIALLLKNHLLYFTCGALLLSFHSLDIIGVDIPHRVNCVLPGVIIKSYWSYYCPLLLVPFFKSP